MASRTHGIDDRLQAYLLDIAIRDTPVKAQLRHDTAQLAEGDMQVAAEQGQMLGFLARVIGARRALELGTFTGYSALAIAEALPEDGRLIACDVSDAWTARGRAAWAAAGVAHKIDLRLGPALETLAALAGDPTVEPFDFVFIDADKKNYDAYYEQSLTLLRPGGLIALDNVLWSGRVADPADHEPITEMFRALNAKLRDDARIDYALLPIADGVILARKR